MIDRDGVIAILTGLASETADVEGAADRILALVRPAGGILLSREEAAMAASWFRRVEADDEVPADAPDHALAARLEAAAGATDAEASR